MQSENSKGIATSKETITNNSNSKINNISSLNISAAVTTNATTTVNVVNNQTAKQADKPALQGVKFKARKRDTNASAKYDPIAFRNDLLKLLAVDQQQQQPSQSEEQPHDDDLNTVSAKIDSLSAKLEAAGQQLDFRKYAEPLFELLLPGKLLAPGGAFIEDGSVTSPISLFLLPTSDKSIVKKFVDMLHKLIRRYKYLQKIFEEQSLKHLLQYINKWSSEDREKLAVATALIITTDLTNASVLTNLRKEHLTKSGISLEFTTKLFQTYLSELPVDRLSLNLRKSGISDLSEFFPPNSKGDKQVLEHYKDSGLPQLVQLQSRKQSQLTKEEIVTRVKAMLIDEEETDDDIVDYLKDQQQLRDLTDKELLQYTWDAMIRNMDWNIRGDSQSDYGFPAQVKSIFPVLKVFTTEPRPALDLINIIQVYCHSDVRITKTFPSIMKQLYAEDIVPDQAILYWASKGPALPGRAGFLEATKGLITFLQKQEEEEDDEEEDE